MLVLERFAPFNIAPVKLDSSRIAEEIFASIRLERVRSAPERDTPSSDASFISDFVKFAPSRLAPVIFAFTSSELEKLTFESNAPDRIEFENQAPDRFDMERFAKESCAEAILAFEKSDDFNSTRDSKAPVKSIL